jgi:hypothetical protein
VHVLLGGIIFDFIPLSYDNVPSNYYLFAQHLGYQLTLSYYNTIANIGLDANVDLFTTLPEAGDLTRDDPKVVDAGYLDRLRFIRTYFTTTAGVTYPVPEGYGRNDYCTVDAECRVPTTVCLKQCVVWYV